MENGYRLSFTGAAFLLSESVGLAKLCVQLGSCTKAVGRLLELGSETRSKSSIKRESREVALRLQTLSPRLLERFTCAAHDEAKIILLYAILKTYPIIKAFCLQVLAEKVAMLDTHLQPYEINTFFRTEEELRPSLEEKSEKTKQKLKQVMLRILADADILSSTKEKVIMKPYIDGGLAKMILRESDESYLRALLQSESDIANIKGRQ